MPLVPTSTPAQKRKVNANLFDPNNPNPGVLPPAQFALMAAAQMHAEGRLVQPAKDQTNGPTDAIPQ